MTQYNSPPEDQGGDNNVPQETSSGGYRSRVRSLIGAPDPRDAIVMRKATPPVGFEYSNAPAQSTLPAGEAPVAPLDTSSTSTMESDRYTPSGDESPSFPDSGLLADDTVTRPELSDQRQDTYDSRAANLDVPGQTQAAHGNAANRDTWRSQPDREPEDGIAETIREEVSLEQIFQEHSTRNRLEMNIPGVTDTPLTFPALNERQNEVGSEEDQLQQTSQQKRSQSDETESGTPQSMSDEGQQRVSTRRQEAESRPSPVRQSSDARETQAEATRSVIPAQAPLSRRDSGQMKSVPEMPVVESQRSIDRGWRTREPEQEVSQFQRVAPRFEQRTMADDTSHSSRVEPRNAVPGLVSADALDSREGENAPDFHYRDRNGANGSYQEAMEQIEQLRASMRQMASRNESQRNRREEDSSSMQRQQPQPQPIVIVHRVPSNPGTPRAFWERSYLNRLRLRTLR